MTSFNYFLIALDNYSWLGLGRNTLKNERASTRFYKMSDQLHCLQFSWLILKLQYHESCFNKLYFSKYYNKCKNFIAMISPEIIFPLVSVKKNISHRLILIHIFILVWWKPNELYYMKCASVSDRLCLLIKNISFIRIFSLIHICANYSLLAVLEGKSTQVPTKKSYFVKKSIRSWGLNKKLLSYLSNLNQTLKFIRF
jgi:hypothetical protein